MSECGPEVDVSVERMRKVAVSRGRSDSCQQTDLRTSCFGVFTTQAELVRPMSVLHGARV